MPKIVYTALPFVSAISDAAVVLAENELGASVDPKKLTLPAKGCAAAIYIGDNIETHDIGDDLVSKAYYDGTRIFSEVFVNNGWMCFNVTDRMLEKYAFACLNAYPFTYPKEAAVPAKGAAADGEAWGYAAALLFTRSRAGKPWRSCAVSNDALFRCLCLISLIEAGKSDKLAFADAVRRSIHASRLGLTGGDNALAMAATLAAYSRSGNAE